MKEKETPFGFMKIESSIFSFVYKEQELLNAEIADICVEDRFKFCDYQPYPVLADIRNVKGFTKEARDLLAKKGNDFVTAAAVLVKSPVERMIVNFYINVSKPAKPTRMFTDEKRALAWLSGFIENSDDVAKDSPKTKSLLL